MWVEPRASRFKTDWLRFFSQNTGRFHRVFLGLILSVLEECAVCPTGFGSSKGTGCPLDSPRPAQERSGQRLQSYILVVKLEAQREVSLRSLQMHVDQFTAASILVKSF